jgi:hypothetical protein
VIVDPIMDLTTVHGPETNIPGTDLRNANPENDSSSSKGKTSTMETTTSTDSQIFSQDEPIDTIFSVTSKIDSDNVRVDFVSGSEKADSIVKANPNSVKEVHHIIRTNNN